MLSPLTLNPPRVVCVVQNLRLRKMLQRALHASGADVEVRSSVREKKTGKAPDVLFIDAPSRIAATTEVLLQVAAEGTRIVMLGESLRDNELIELVRDGRLNHLISDIQNVDESELITTAVKLLTSDIFGIEKYLLWGALIHELDAATYADKQSTVDMVAGYAQSVGARGRLVARIEAATDELLMNALYDAPVSRCDLEDSSKKRVAKKRGSTWEPPSSSCAIVRFGSDGRYFALSVQDDYGSLSKETLLSSLLRARRERGRPLSTGSGAGLGIYFLFTCATRFILNTQPGRRTEVICLFDLRETGRQAAGHARSLHVFTDDGSPAIAMRSAR